jgi:putative ABC transport system permease protein
LVLALDHLNAIVFGGFAAVELLISVVGVAGVLATGDVNHQTVEG